MTVAHRMTQREYKATLLRYTRKPRPPRPKKAKRTMPTWLISFELPARVELIGHPIFLHPACRKRFNVWTKSEVRARLQAELGERLPVGFGELIQKVA